MITIYEKAKDIVLDSVFLTGVTSYEYALQNIYPLINRFDYQRKIQDPSFYERLLNDIIEGCIMPPITLAFVLNENFIDNPKKYFEDYITNNINKGYILDGIQRLNTLHRASKDKKFPLKQPIYLNLLISSSQDKLLYRMITLNNGQKPMTPRHQIEILTQENFDFPSLQNIHIQTEKDDSQKRVFNSFKMSDISKAYLAFLTNDVNNENNKIISQEMDKIIVKRIMDQGVPKDRIEFMQVIQEIDIKSSNIILRDWFRIENNLIGFVVGIKTTFSLFQNTDLVKLTEIINSFEKSFSIINVSKVKLGQIRREMVRNFFIDYENTSQMSDDELREYINKKTL